MKHLFTSFFILLLFVGCNEKPNIVGLWKVTSVTSGEENMTPNGRWMRFHENGTQESGNGWLQHSVGTWSLNAEDQSLTVINTNGLKDPSDPFIVALSPTEMTWTRTEGTIPVEVKLVRTDKLPKINADALFGLWLIEEANGNGDYFSAGEMGGLFLRWDRRFEMYTQNGTVYGVYNVHGHKSEVELIPYGGIERSWWDLDVDETKLKIKLLNTDSLVTRSFKRIYEFPE